MQAGGGRLTPPARCAQSDCADAAALALLPTAALAATYAVAQAAVEGRAVVVPVARMPSRAALGLETGRLTKHADLLVSAALAVRIDALVAARHLAAGAIA